MATVLPTYQHALLTGTSIDLENVTVKVVLVTSDRPHSASVEFLSDIAAANRVMASDAITVTVTGTNVDFADGVTLNDEGNGKTSSQAYVYVDTGTESTSRLIYHDDSVALTSDGTNDVLNAHASGLFDL